MSAMVFKSLVKLDAESEIDMKTVREYSFLFDLTDLSRHPKLTQKHVEMCPEIKWNWCHLVQRFPELDVVGILTEQRSTTKKRTLRDFQAASIHREPVLEYPDKEW